MTLVRRLAQFVQDMRTLGLEFNVNFALSKGTANITFMLNNPDLKSANTIEAALREEFETDNSKIISNYLGQSVEMTIKTETEQL